MPNIVCVLTDLNLTEPSSMSAIVKSFLERIIFMVISLFTPTRTNQILSLSVFLRYLAHI